MAIIAIAVPRRLAHMLRVLAWILKMSAGSQLRWRMGMQWRMGFNGRPHVTGLPLARS
jgi:hypothetical protein